VALIDDTRVILGDLIAFPTVSADSNLGLIAYIANRLSDCGASISIFRDDSGAKANLFATIGPAADGGIVLSGHTDVVPADANEWSSDPFVMREAGSRLYGRGSCDMKGFIAAALAMAPRLGTARLRRPLHFAFTYDEEVGCLGARRLINDLARTGFRPSVAIIGEPTMMRIIEGHKGCYEYTTEFHGLNGHASNPDAGVNAIEYAVRYINRMMALAEELKHNPAVGNRYQPPWTTLQVGRMEGGTARNVIAHNCRVEWEMRPVRKSDADYVKRELSLYCDEVLLPAMLAVAQDASIETQVIGEVSGLAPASDNEARNIVSSLTGRDDCEVVPFGSEAGLFQACGMSAVVCGPGSIEQAHKADEFVAIEQLQACLDMLSGLARRLSVEG
jgi:acetylornithine deacetylase